MGITEEEIKKIVGTNAYLRGKTFDINEIEFLETTDIGSMRYYEFKVESQSNYDYYEVYVITKNGKITGGTCECPAYDTMGHVNT